MNARPKALALTMAFLACCAAMAFVSCSDPDNISTVNVTLREFSVSVDQRTVPQGEVTFHVTNAGTVPHEFLVIRTSLAADALPTTAEGAFNEAARAPTSSTRSRTSRPARAGTSRCRSTTTAMC